MTGFDQPTLDFYAGQAIEYLGHRPEHINQELIGFLPLLPAGARILELGCGGGVDSAYMIAQGFDVDPTDGVAAMARAAEERLNRPVRVMRFDELDAVETYDAVIANASLLHAPAKDLPDILRRIWCALKPGGWHLATYKTDDEPGYDDHGRYYNYLSRANADVQYRAAGEWAAIDYDEFPGTGYFSAPANWLKVTARKEGSV